MRRLRWPVVALVLFVFAAPAARAGTLVFGEATCRSVAGCMSLWVVGDDGTGLRKLPATDALWATWSHDGSRMAYQYGQQLRSIRVDGSDDRLIFWPVNSYLGNPDWSPTEDLIAFTYTDMSGPGVGGPLPGLHTSDIHVIRSDGSGMRRVAGGPGNEDSVRFTADGQRLEYYRNAYPMDSGESGLYSIALDGTDERRMTLGEGVYLPTPSPDGRYLAYIRNGIVWTVEADGRNARAWTLAGGGADGPLRWSPDGPRLFFRYTMEEEPPYSSITVHVADMSNPDAGATPLLPGSRIDMFHDWTAAEPGATPPTGEPQPTDETAPAVLLLDTRRAAASARGRGRVISKRGSRLFAFDMTGIRTVQVAVAREQRRRRARRCRFLGATRFSRPRRCSKPIFRTIGSGAAFNERLEGLRPGRYLMAFRTKDVAGNHQRRPRLARVTLRP